METILEKKYDSKINYANGLFVASMPNISLYRFVRFIRFILCFFYSFNDFNHFKWKMKPKLNLHKRMALVTQFTVIITLQFIRVYFIHNYIADEI